ncbi:MAG: hypothetical protein IPF94_10875 [Betaproteobacteria bacterium]|nr:hypothetical protein [Betaproteobacteria bacterium]
MYFTGLAFGNGSWIALQPSGEVWRSTDRRAWTKTAPASREFWGFGNSMASVAFHGDTFYVSGRFSDTKGVRQNVIASSKDGADWRIAYKGVISTGAGLMKSVGSRIYYYGYYGMLYSSTDGIDWSQQVTGTSDERIVDVAESPAGLGVLSITNTSSRIRLRTGGALNFQSPVEIHNGILWGLAFGANKWIAVGVGGSAFTSADGVTWSKLSLGTTSNLINIRRVGGNFYVSDDSGKLFVSTNGETWSTHEPPGRTSGFQLAAGTVSDGSRLAIARDDGVAISDGDGRWEHVSFSKLYLTKIAYLKGNFIGCGSEKMLVLTDQISAGDANIYSSADGKNWSKVDMQGLSSDCRYWQETPNGIFSGDLFSPDGLNWRTLPLPRGDSQAFVNGKAGSQIASTYYQGKFIYWLTRDFLAWEELSSSAELSTLASLPRPEYGMTYNSSMGGIIGIFGNSGKYTVGLSPDGQTWTELSALPAYVFNVNGIATDGRATVLVGSRNATQSSDLPAFIARSSDGVHWFDVIGALDNQTDFEFVKHNGSEWLAGGRFGTIATSQDGQSWNLQSARTGKFFNSAAFGNGRWLFTTYEGAFFVRE